MERQRNTNLIESVQDTFRYDMIWYGMVWYGTLRSGTVCCCMMWCLIMILEGLMSAEKKKKKRGVEQVIIDRGPLSHLLLNQSIYDD